MLAKSGKTALITGITGQDGSYLTELLLAKGYRVFGIIRRASSFNTGRIDHLYNNAGIYNKTLFLRFGDLNDSSSLAKIIREVEPGEIYNLAAQSHVRVSFDIPEYTAEITAMGTIRLLEAIRMADIDTRFYQASSSEMFGKVAEVPQNEKTPFHPRSPYAISKVFSYHATINYREAYGLFASNGILFNHESPRRGETFVTRKITRGVARILAGSGEKILLGNTDARRDWGFAGDYVEAMWLMLQHTKPDDFVVATGEQHSVKEFLKLSFEMAGLDWRKHVGTDPRYYRPSEVQSLLGDPSKARRVLGWRPKVTFRGLVKMMLESDMALEGVNMELRTHG